MARRRRKKQGTVLSSVIVLVAIAWGLFTKAGSDPSGSQFLKDFTGNHDEHVTNRLGMLLRRIRPMAVCLMLIIRSSLI